MKRAVPRSVWRLIKVRARRFVQVDDDGLISPDVVPYVERQVITQINQAAADRDAVNPQIQKHKRSQNRDGSADYSGFKMCPQLSFDCVDQVHAVCVNRLQVRTQLWSNR